jgi:hypothetical protein
MRHSSQRIHDAATTASTASVTTKKHLFSNLVGDSQRTYKHRWPPQLVGWPAFVTSAPYAYTSP